MNFKFFIRLDDACPRMHSENWKRVLKILSTFDIKPIIAVIPDNQDESLMYDKENEKCLLILPEFLRKFSINSFF